MKDQLVSAAIKAMDSDLNIGWTVAFGLKSYCKTEEGFIFELEKGESLRYVNCVKPFKRMNWFCFETNLDCSRESQKGHLK